MSERNTSPILRDYGEDLDWSLRTRRTHPSSYRLGRESWARTRKLLSVTQRGLRLEKGRESDLSLLSILSRCHPDPNRTCVQDLVLTPRGSL